MWLKHLAPFAVLLLLAVTAPPLRAQYVLYAERNGKMLLVRKAHDRHAMVEDGGKLVPAYSGKFVLRPVDEYLPVFVAIRDINVRVRYLEVLDTASQLNNDFEFRGEFETPYLLDDVFMVLDLDLKNQGRSLLVHEIGRLEPRRPRRLNLVVPLLSALGEGRYQVHVFSGYQEVLHSLQPAEYREQALDRMVSKRLEGRADGPPRLFVGPAPDYPASLRAARRSGRVTVCFTVRSNGMVANPSVEDASDPALIGPTLDAVRLWRFLPQLRGGHAVETAVRLPVAFDPPDPAAAASR